MSDRPDTVLPRMRAFLSYLADLAGEAGVPRKTELDPIEIGQMGILPQVWLVEREGDTDFRYKIAGETIIEAFAQPIRGRLGSELFDPDTWAEVSRRWRRCLTDGQAYFNNSSIVDPKGYQHHGARIAVPLLDQNGVPNFVVGLTLYGRITQVNEQPTAAKVAFLQPTYFDLKDHASALSDAPNEKAS